jgi:hypothetical protein
MYIKNQKLKDNMSKPLTELINKMLTQQKSNKVNFIIENKELLKSLVKDSCLMSKIFLL